MDKKKASDRSRGQTAMCLLPRSGDRAAAVLFRAGTGVAMGRKSGITPTRFLLARTIYNFGNDFSQGGSENRVAFDLSMLIAVLRKLASGLMLVEVHLTDGISGWRYV